MSNPNRRPPVPALERFFGYMVPEPNTGCWLWMAHHNRDGYATFFESRGGEQSGHRYAYKTFVGPIPTGLALDHLCRNRGCVNPAHLEAVTHRENILRGRSPLREQTHCKRGHEFDEKNTLWARRLSSGRMTRQCRACRARLRRERRARLRAAA